MILHLIGDEQMKRVLAGALSVFFVAALLGLAGCDSGGIQEGAPTDAGGGIPLSQGGADMAGGKTPPPSVKPLPKSGADAAAPGGAAPAPAPEKEKGKGSAHLRESLVNKGLWRVATRRKASSPHWTRMPPAAYPAAFEATFSGTGPSSSAKL